MGMTHQMSNYIIIVHKTQACADEMQLFNLFNLLLLNLYEFITISTKYIQCFCENIRDIINFRRYSANNAYPNS